MVEILVMTDDRELRAFYAALAAICYLVTIAAVLAAFGKYTEAIGVGAAVTGLLALMKSPFSVTPARAIDPG